MNPLLKMARRRVWLGLAGLMLVVAITAGGTLGTPIPPITEAAQERPADYDAEPGMPVIESFSVGESTPGSVTLVWTTTNPLHSYQIYRVDGSTYNARTAILLAAILQDNYSFTDYEVFPQRTYTYRIDLWEIVSGVLTHYNQTLTVTVPAPHISDDPIVAGITFTPWHLVRSPANRMEGQFVVTQRHPTDTSPLSIRYRWRKVGTDDDSFSEITGHTTKAFHISPLKAGTTYEMQASMDSDYGIRAESFYVTAPEPEVTHIVVSEIDQTSVTFSIGVQHYSNVLDEDVHYRLYRGGAWEKGTQTVNQYNYYDAITISDLTAGTVYELEASMDADDYTNPQTVIFGTFPADDDADRDESR